ncbi:MULTISPECIES: class I SAM-dependent methyltransferase [unclassified Rathayibacter]|uniref:class I SAM-dependent methyltransferase n=1 Tax=unclassified Rathayibacter TaxID=2609250 RepID=UPI00188CBBD5|nr:MULTISPECIES: class I SAM-dependent methyltransferase [unclassified Rathayibacter]MBF4461006.1 class I SAM-dependent methyltransferase [Rathayibacter sp. VKM Ac-2879]MBF4502417.1 class I SAM-dependent methyltransferase [Rathayibacter sp. VKM Ac-2878]
MAIKPEGDYGIDAPWVPWMWVGYTVLYAALTAAAATLWNDEWWVVALFALLTVVFAAAAALYWYVSLRGKFVLWDRLLSTVALPSGARVLDLGCGHGMVSIMTALRSPESTVTGIDLWRSIDQSGNTPDAARSNAELNGVGDRVRFDTGDMTKLPYPDGSFDLVTASVSIHNIRSREGRRTAIAEAARVLAPGGRIVAADIRRTTEYADDLRSAGFAVTTLPLGWRGWWSGPWMSTTAVSAAMPSRPA